MCFFICFFYKKTASKIKNNIAITASIIWMLLFFINYFVELGEALKWILYFWSVSCSIFFLIVQILVMVIDIFFKRGKKQYSNSQTSAAKNIVNFSSSNNRK